MSNLNHNSYRYLGFVTVALAVIAIASPVVSNAQTVKDPEGKALESAQEYKKSQDEIINEFGNVEDMLYSKDKKGCAMKASMFGIVAKKYRQGLSVEEAVDIKIMQPLYKNIYKKIRKTGLEKSLLNNMVGYQKCVANAQPNSDAGAQYDMSLVNDACASLNAAIVDTLVSIKKRRKIDGVFKKYQRENIDLTGTAYENIPDAALMFIGSLYKTSQTKKYLDVVEMGSNIASGCSS